MPAIEPAQIDSQRSMQAQRSAVLLTCAGLVVIGVACAEVLLWASIVSKNAGADSWGSDIYGLLGMVLVAIVLGVGTFAEPTSEGMPIDPGHSRTGQTWLVFAALVLIHCSVAFLLNRTMPAGTIDTYTFQRDSCKTLLQGIDPYGATQANIFDSFHTKLFFGPGMVVNGRVQVGFQYPPLTLLWVLPGYFMGDVRDSYILAVVISAMLLLAICPGKRGLWIVAILLLSPLTWWVENRCWTEPLVLMTLSISVYAAVKKRWWLPIALGLFLAAKQYNFLALPFIGYFVCPFRWKEYWKLTFLSLAVGVATVLPFAFWNFRGLWHDLVLFHLAQPFREDAVSFAVPFPWMLKIGPILVLAFVVWAVRAEMRKPTMFAAAYGVSLLLFVSTSKQAFSNYYFLIAQALFLAVAALPTSAERTRESRGQA